MELAFVWLAAAALGLVATRWKLRARDAWTWMAAVLWFAPTAALWLGGRARPVFAPGSRWLLAAAALGLFALLGRHLRQRYRSRTQATRLLLLYGALLVPVLVLYPVAWFFADTTARQIVPATRRRRGTSPTHGDV
jgi:hypothetical protein